MITHQGYIYSYKRTREVIGNGVAEMLWAKKKLKGEFKNHSSEKARMYQSVGSKQELLK